MTRAIGPRLTLVASVDATDAVEVVRAAAAAVAATPPPIATTAVHVVSVALQALLAVAEDAAIVPATIRTVAAVGTVVRLPSVARGSLLLPDLWTRRLPLRVLTFFPRAKEPTAYGHTPHPSVSLDAPGRLC